METLNVILNDATKRDVIALFKAVRKADGYKGLGFDHAKVSKADLIDRLMANHDNEKIKAIFDDMFEVEEEDDAPDAPAPDAPAPAKAATPKAPKAPKSDDAASELADALAKVLAKGTVNPDDVREIVREEVARQSLGYRGVEIKDGDTVRKIEGYVRKEFDRIIRYAKLRLPQMIIGPTGSGKSHIAGQVADAFGLSFSAVSCTAGVSEADLLGRLLPTGEGGRFEFHDAPFLRAYEQGGVFLLDELDAADPNVLLVLDQALANGRMFVPQRFDNPEVKRHPDFVCIAAANTWGTGASTQYTGRERLDEATLDRFRAARTFLDYDTAFEKQACDPEVLAWAYGVRQTIMATGMRRVMGTRFLLNASQIIAAGGTLDEVKENYFLGWTPDEIKKLG